MNERLLIDEKYRWLLSKYQWFIMDCKNRNKKYVFKGLGPKKNPQMVGLHRVIMALEKNDPIFLLRKWEYVDHINGNGLDNRISNLRMASNSLNQINKKIQSNNTSGYKGVTYSKQSRKYYVRFTVGKKDRRYGGSFKSKHDAARKYNEMVKKIWGNNVILNEINEEVSHRQGF